MKRILIITLAIAGIIVGLMLVPTMLLAQPIPTQPSTWSRVKALYAEPDATTSRRDQVQTEATYGGDWSNNIVSEAFYALSQSRSGGSGRSYYWGGNNNAMGDWNYVNGGSDNGALNNVGRYIGWSNAGTYWNTWNGYWRGGYCKFFVDLVLYRSSYGIGNRYHLILPGGGYDYSRYMTPYSVSQARPGWVIQRISSPHSAIVVANLPNGLDVIDSNYIGGDGSFVISRHPLTWSQLAGFTAYRATFMEQF